MRSKLENGQLTIFLEGRIDTSNAPDTEKYIETEIAENGVSEGNVIFDANDLAYISSAGLRVLMKIRKKAGKVLDIVNVSRDVYDIFETTGFTDLLNVQKKMRELSVEGCEIIGKGGNGTVYRLDDDKIVKVYAGQGLEIVKREQEHAKIAFVNGIPSIIPYDVVKVGDDYGTVFEMVRSDTLGHVIAKEPERMMELVDEYVALAKTLHSTHIEKGKIPDIRTLFHDRADRLDRWCSAEEIGILHDIIDKMPEADTVLHNDLHPGNIMIQDGELVLIDLAEVTVGPKVFDLSSIFRDMISGVRTNPELSEMTMGMPVDMIEKVGQLFFMKYTGIEPDGLKDYFDKLGLVYGLNVVLLCGAGIGETEKYADGIMDRLLRGVLIPNRDAIPQVIAGLSA
ncbi:MAG: phosphotransferase [Eubacterium sp.]|nr:phosphotransferase [Eubacterium sp.]